jgi:hypothetical protein
MGVGKTKHHIRGTNAQRFRRHYAQLISKRRCQSEAVDGNQAAARCPVFKEQHLRGQQMQNAVRPAVLTVAADHLDRKIGCNVHLGKRCFAADYIIHNGFFLIILFNYLRKPVPGPFSTKLYAIRLAESNIFSNQSLNGINEFLPFFIK